MKILQIIMSHREALPTVERHKPIWMSVTKNTIFVSPINSLMGVKNEAAIGFRQHHGELSAQRIVGIFDLANHLNNWDYLLLNEYDSFALSLPEDVISEAGGISAAAYKQNKPDKFKAGFYVNYPILFTKEAVRKIRIHLPNIKSLDRYYSDRFIGRAIEIGGIPIKNLRRNKRAFTKNTILPEHYDKLRKAVKAKCVFFHGVKNLEVLSQIIEIPVLRPIK